MAADGSPRALGLFRRPHFPCHAVCRLHDQAPSEALSGRLKGCSNQGEMHIYWVMVVLSRMTKIAMLGRQGILYSEATCFELGVNDAAFCTFNYLLSSKEVHLPHSSKLKSISIIRAEHPPSHTRTNPQIIRIPSVLGLRLISPDHIMHLFHGVFFVFFCVLL